LIAVVDYGLGNLRSVSKAIEFLGAEVKITQEPDTIGAASAIVLPGVGAFAQGMNNLRKTKIPQALFQAIDAGKPFLGICLGLQLLFSQSSEYQTTKGLDIIKGSVSAIEPGVKVPHMGWNQVKQTNAARCAKFDLFKDIPDNSYFYFAHSFYVSAEDQEVVTGVTDYGKYFCSAVAKDNVFAVQFHPEKSGNLGLKIIENFLNIAN
jgi:glutamine amidotransferase